MKISRINSSCLLALLFLVSTNFAQETLRSLATKRGFNIGVAVGSALWEGDTAYKSTIKREFNIVVSENVLKFDAVEPSKNHFVFTHGDEIVNFAQQNGMAVRGHNLVWSSSSGWIEKAAPNLPRAEVFVILKNHIDSVLTHYKGKMLEWDVVNEAIDDNTGMLRDTFWRKSLGDTYLDSAFIWAHKADPKAILFYNDYYNEGMNKKSDSIYAMVKAMRARGVPVQGVGLQCHLQNGEAMKLTEIDQNLKRLQALGLRVSITEVDFIMGLPTDLTELNLQKKNYHDLLAVCLANDSCKSFLTWGVSDLHSWVPEFFPGNGASLPFDEKYNPKPAYYGLKAALSESAPISIRSVKIQKLKAFGSFRVNGETGVVFTRERAGLNADEMRNSLGKTVKMRSGSTHP